MTGDYGRRHGDRLHCGYWMGGEDICVRPFHRDAEGRDDGTPHRAPSRMSDRLATSGEMSALASIQKAVQSRHNDLSWCMKDDDCHAKAETVEVVLADIDAAVEDWRKVRL